ncbi:MAG: CotH kinase family protein, partial [Verrucomicrobiota bacterium]
GMPGPGGPGGGGGRGPGLNLQGSEGRRNGLASAMGVEFNYVHADFEFDGKIFKDAAVRYKGNGTWMQSRGSDKRSMKVDLNEYVKGQKLNGISKLNFHNCVTDSSWMNEVLSHALFRDAGVPAPRTAYARVSITVPGKLERKYTGLYSMVENLDDNFADRHFGTKKGAILKPVTPAPFTDMGDDWKNYNQTYDPKTDLKPEQKQRVIDFCKLVSHADDATFAAKVGDFVELDQFARFMAVTVWLSTLDSILSVGQNYYVYLHPQTQKFQFMPWDLDHSFGQFFLMGNQEQRDNLSIHRPWRGENRFLDRVFKVDAFKQLYLARLAEFSETIFQPERFEKQVDAIAAAIRDAVKDESEEKLARFDKVAAGEAVPPAGFGGGFGGPRPGGGDAGAPSRGPAPGFFSPAKPIKAFVKVRAQSVRDQLAGKSKGESIPEFGFGQRGPGGRGGDFGPGNFLGGPLMTSLDGNKDSELTRAEVVDGFKRWFHSWNTDKSGTLTEEQLRAGITQELTPFRGGPGGGNPAGGPPPR